MTATSKKRVGIWIRVSTEDQARGESPQHHEVRGRGYAEAKDWAVAEVYNLSGVSGKSVIEHPEAKRMLKDIRTGHISALIFSKLARLARNTRELLDIADMFREQGAGLISLQEAIDTTSPAGRLFYTMIAAMAQWEREEISERVAASVPVRAKLGKPLGGAAPFGYQWKDNELVVDPKEAPIRKLMFELYLTHRRKRTVARVLNEMGHRTRKGKKFSDNTVTRLLTDTIAKGQRRANYTKSRGDKMHWDLKPEEEWVYTDVEPIVSEELWNEVNSIISAQFVSKKRVGRKPVTHLFSGVTTCSCGGPMYVPYNSPKYTCRKCRNKIHVEDLEEIYKEQLKTFLLSKDDLNDYLNQAHSVIEEKVQILEVLEKERSDLQGEMDKAYELYTSGNISKDGFGRKYAPLDERLNQLNEEIPKVQSEVDFLKIQNLSSEQAFTETQALSDRWDTLSKNEQLGFIETLTESIVVGDKEVSVNLHYLPFLRSNNLATNPCPCGYQGDKQGDCRCSAEAVQRYRGKISGPLLDRIDIHIEVNRPPVESLRPDAPKGESSKVAAERIKAARAIQHKRNGCTNAAMPGSELHNAFKADKACFDLLEKATESLSLSARSYQRVQRVARTIADLSESETVKVEHMAEALGMRKLDRGL